MIIEEKSRRCNNCFKYPFCKRCNAATEKCEDWKSKCETTMALESKNGYDFNFIKIEGDS